MLGKVLRRAEFFVIELQINQRPFRHFAILVQTVLFVVAGKCRDQFRRNYFDVARCGPRKSFIVFPIPYMTNAHYHPPPLFICKLVSIARDF
jgi:hypothetical protein